MSLVTGKSSYGLYPLGDGKFLFVPNEEMWSLHEASKTPAICSEERANLGGSTYRQWVSRFGDWIIKWLYTYPSLPPAEAPIGFSQTDEMIRFRKNATKQAIRQAARRPKENIDAAWRKDRGEFVSDPLVSYWRNNGFKGHDWFDSFLFRGTLPRRDIMVVPIQHVRRCLIAWDVLAIRDAAKIGSGSFLRWLTLRQIPTLNWLKWLFGAPEPLGAFVVDVGLQKLRWAKSEDGILATVNKRKPRLSDSTFSTWKNSQSINGPFAELIAGGDPRTPEGWDALEEVTQRKMLRVKEALAEEAVYMRAGISRSTHQNKLREAEARGVRDHLEKYLGMVEPYADRPRAGLVADNFFIPTPDMLAFRTKATEQGLGQSVWALANDTPGFDEWFYDWVVPKPHHGKRIQVGQPASNTSSPTDDRRRPMAPQTSPQPSQPIKPKRGRPRVSEADCVVAEAWGRAKANKVQKKDFARDNRLTLKNLNRILNRVRMSHRRKPAHTN